MSYSQKWWVIVALLFAFALTVSVLTAQTKEPSAVNDPGRTKAQADSVGAQASSDEPEQKQPTLEPNRDTASADVETERRFNELRRELLDDRAKMIDDRAKTLDWWLAATAIFLTFLGVGAAILGYFGFKRLDKIESEARENVEASEKHAQEAQRYQEEAQRDLEEIKDEAQRNLEEIKARRGEADSLVEGMNAKVAGSDPDKASEVVENVQQNPDSSLIERAIAAALSLQQQNRIEEAIEKWRSIANITEGIDDERAALAWFSIGYLVPSKDGDGDDFERAIEAYDKTIQLDPNSAEAYNNRGNVKGDLGQYEAAIADYDVAIDLNPDDANAYYNRGNVKSDLSQYEAAIADFDAAIDRNPDYVEAYNNRGMAKSDLGQDEAAIADFDAAIDRNPDDADAYYNRGIAKVQLQRIDEARQDFEMALNLARMAGDTDLMTQAERALEDLDRGDAP